ncbi:response regulator [filamentous cyanobacterium LEGE 11480]|uniref:histidine kinase n=2 Tax=Romeriopsis TaxID=2992131 RepID=A0A928Z1W8_9CYAN|nr:response regulator [Romeriopsis navalis LEGE 11480]
MQVLVIEDEADVRLNIVEILESGGFQPIDAADGRVGLAIAQSQHPDLIICDIKMPDLDGYEVLEAIRNNPSTATLPFIFLTAKTDLRELRQGMNLGADDYLTKPFRRIELLETIAARLRKHEGLRQLELQIGELQENNSHRSDVLNTITHDLRAPLTTIKVALQMMETLPDNRPQYMDIAFNACAQGDELIQNLLDLYQLEAGEMKIEPRPLDLQETFRNLYYSFKIRTENQQQQLKWDVPEVLPPMISDGISIQRVLVELLTNASKYTPTDATIAVKVRESDAQETVPRLIIQVQNQGEIAADALPRLFEKFYRVPGGDRHKHGGTGLGLTLVHRLVEQLQGRITVSSDQGWTKFKITLPCEMQ